MLVIRKAQMAVLGDYMRQSFEDLMVRHLAISFAPQFKAMTSASPDDQPVRALIKQGIERAARYQIISRRDVGRFIEVMVAVDPTFDERKDLAWTRQILQHPGFTSQGKMDLIYQRLRDPENAHLLQNHSQHVPGRQ